jgi:hypothetical protein
MRNSVAVVSVAVAAAAAVSMASRPAHAGMDVTPRGPGNEVVDAEGHVVGVHPGWEASGGGGTGFAGTYSGGIEARVGYTLPFGLYVGGQAQGYWGNTVGSNQAHASFFGAEVGYKLFLLRQVEFRPYVFGGEAFITQVGSNSFNSHTGVAVQPGIMGLYHLGSAFLGGEFRFLTTPGPVSPAIMFLAGAGF